MNYVAFMPTLEYRAVVRIVIALWNQNDIRALMSSLFDEPNYNCRRENWKEIEDVVVAKVPKLLLPVALKERVYGLIHVIGLQILKWMEFHDGNEYLGINLPNELCWTSQGTVDEKSTTEMIVKDENLDITVRYKLACINCLEKYIVALWNKMPESDRMSFYHEDVPLLESYHWELVILWTYDMKKELHKLGKFFKINWRSKCTPYQCAFEFSAGDGNKLATEYFLQKLTHREREKSLVKFTTRVAKERRKDSGNSLMLLKENYADVFCYLLSQLQEEQQIQFFKSNALNSLLCFLDWPFHCFFMDTAKLVWDYLEGYEFRLILRAIVDKMKGVNRDATYKSIFGEFWQQSPLSHKKYFLDGILFLSENILPDLLELEDQGNTKMLLGEMTDVKKEKFLLSWKGISICEKLVYNKKWDVVKFFILECVPTKESMFELQERFMEYALNSPEADSDNMWILLLKLLDELTQTLVEKRRLEDIQNPPAKKLCNA